MNFLEHRHPGFDNRKAPGQNAKRKYLFFFLQTPGDRQNNNGVPLHYTPCSLRRRWTIHLAKNIEPATLFPKQNKRDFRSSLSDSPTGGVEISEYTSKYVRYWCVHGVTRFPVSVQWAQNRFRQRFDVWAPKPKGPEKAQKFFAFTETTPHNWKFNRFLPTVNIHYFILSRFGSLKHTILHCGRSSMMRNVMWCAHSDFVRIVSCTTFE